jgi:protein O-mannosyl-transferase
MTSFRDAPTKRRWFDLPPAVLSVVLGGLIVALYLPAIRNGFIDFDDPDYVTENPHLHPGLTMETVRWAFTDTRQAGFWHPLTWLSHALDVACFGLNPAGHHATSVLLHALNVVLVFVVLRQLTGATGRSLLVAALFGFHPLRVESVAWVAERKDVLSAAFALLAVAAYARFALTPARGLARRAWFVAALVAFALGLMAKPMVVTLPFVLLLLDYWPLGRQRGTRPVALALEKLPFFGAALAASAMAFLAQHASGATSVGVPFGARLGNAIVAYGRYVEKTIWPSKLAAFYPHPGYWPVGTVALSLVAWLVVTAAVVAQRRSRPYLLVGWLWFIGMLVPAIGLVQVGEQAMADRFSYLPSIGLCIAFVWGGHALLAGRRRAMVAGGIAALLIVAAEAAAARRQIGAWHDTETLFRSALAVTTRNHVAHLCLGVALERAGRLDAAAAEYRAAIDAKPQYASAHLNLGFVLARQRQFAAARSELAEAERLQADPAKVRFGMGMTYAGEGATAEAIAAFGDAARIRPDWAAAHHNLAMALVHGGRGADAIRELRAATELEPGSANAHFELATALSNANQLPEAIAEFRRSLQLDGSRFEARVNLANSLARAGALVDAIGEFRRATAQRPEVAEVHNSLGLALALHGELEPALGEFERAVQLRPGYAEAAANRDRALALRAAAAGGPAGSR